MIRSTLLDPARSNKPLQGLRRARVAEPNRPYLVMKDGRPEDF
jgi:hypothetical protein